MADTDDQQNVELDPTEQDEGPESARERRLTRARERRDERLDAVAGLTAEEEARRLEEELQQRRDDDFERAAHEEQELEEKRNRREQRTATAETARAIQLAEIAETVADNHRSDADLRRYRARAERPHAHRLLDEAAAEPDAPGADAKAAAGRRHERAAYDDEARARVDDRIADGQDAKARALKAEAASARQPGQPPAADAVYPPRETPVARIVRERPRKKRLDKDKEDPNALRHLGLGD